MIERPGRGGETLPVFDANEPEPAGDPIPARPLRRGLGPARGAGIAIALLVLLVGGIVVGSLPKAASPSASTTSSNDAPVVVRPTGGATSCHEPSAARSPALSLSVQDVPYAVDTPFSVSYPADHEPALAQAWPLPPLSGALYPKPEDKIVIGADLGACIQTLAVTYAPADDIPTRTGVAALFEEIFQPPAHAISFEGIRSGDWVLRAEAHFDAAGAASATGLVVVSFFRVVAGVPPAVSDAPLATPSGGPAETPVVACAPGSPTSAVGVRLTGGLGGPVLGVEDTAINPGIPQPPIPVVDVGLGDVVRLEVDGDYCATSWDIQLVDGSGRSSDVAVATNPADDPRVAAQDRWVVSPIGDELLVANLHFRGGPDIARVWHVIVREFVTPVAVLVGDDGTRFDAEYSCGLEVALHNGYSSSESCAGIDYAPGEAALHVTAFRPISFEIPGWRIRSWSGSCGKVAEFAFTVVNGCSLGGGASQGGAALDSPITFVLPPGDTVVLIHADAIARNGDSFGVDYFAHVIAR